MRYVFVLTLPALLLGAARSPQLPSAIGPAIAHSTPPLAAPGRILPDAQRLALFARTNLGRLWQHQPQAGTADVLNGCYGYDGRRLEFVFTSVQPEAQHPGRYQVAGKFRCYDDVTPFRGSISLQQVQRLANDATLYRDGQELPTPTYCATGSFALKATSTRGLGGQFDGQVALDFHLEPTHKAVLAGHTTNPITRNGGLLFEGDWRDGPNGDAVPVVWKQGMAVTRQVLSHFEMGGRSPHINDKYARVGWNTYWENKEWWADKPVARR